ncbi:MAG: class I SAM-dependent methyltransferase [Candidatus Hydrogenedentes bacterium]|nr:class I SAM-dependent methyltransferase [Candidatus Hydrogenedentota bacterium]
MSHEIQEFYRENPLMVSSPFGGVSGVHRDLFDDVIRKLNLPLDGQSILDVGCGRGFVGEVVRAHGGRYTGADLVRNGTGFSLALADAMNLPFRDESFDGVFCIDAFEHIPDGVRAAREFRRVLRPGGFVFLSAPNYGNVAGIVKWWCEAFGFSKRDSWAPFRRWQPQELEQALTQRRIRAQYRSAGFGRATRIGHAPEVGLGLFPWIDHPRMPEAVQFRLQRAFASVGPAIVRFWPGASLHVFWKFEV